MAPRGGTPSAHPGRSPERGEQDARHLRDLETRVYGGDLVSRADVDELRRLLTRPVGDTAGGAGRGGGRGPGADRAGGPGSPDPAPPMSAAATRQVGPVARPSTHPALAAHVGVHPRLWLAGGVIAVILAATISGAVATSVARAGAEALAHPVSTTKVIGSPVVASTDGPVAEAETLGAQYFATPQTGADRPGIPLHGIVPATTHRVLTQIGPAPGRSETDVWVAQGDDGSFCLIMAVGTGRGALSCTPEADVVAAGVQLDMVLEDGASIDVSWSLSSGLLAFTPYPLGASVDDTPSGGGSPTP